MFNEIEQILKEKSQSLLEMIGNFESLETQRFNFCEYYNMLKCLKPYLPTDMNNYQSAIDKEDDNSNY